MKKHDEGFSYTYSAQQQDEIEAIRSKYLPPEEDKMEQLRRLDRSAQFRATMTAIVVGLVSTLVLGTGMSLCLVWGKTLMIPGIVVGVAGIAGMAAAMPLYQIALKKEQQRIAPQILRLADELTGRSKG